MNVDGVMQFARTDYERGWRLASLQGRSTNVDGATQFVGTDYERGWRYAGFYGVTFIFNCPVLGSNITVATSL